MKLIFVSLSMNSILNCCLYFLEYYKTNRIPKNLFEVISISDVLGIVTCDCIRFVIRRKATNGINAALSLFTFCCLRNI